MAERETKSKIRARYKERQVIYNGARCLQLYILALQLAVLAVGASLENARFSHRASGASRMAAARLFSLNCCRHPWAQHETGASPSVSPGMGCDSVERRPFLCLGSASRWMGKDFGGESYVLASF